jgi:hypothetical protein
MFATGERGGYAAGARDLRGGATPGALRASGHPHLEHAVMVDVLHAAGTLARDADAHARKAVAGGLSLLLLRGLIAAAAAALITLSPRVLGTAILGPQARHERLILAALHAWPQGPSASWGAWLHGLRGAPVLPDCCADVAV